MVTATDETTSGHDGAWVVKCIVSLIIIGVVAVLGILPGPVMTTSAVVSPVVAFSQVDGREVVIIGYTDQGWAGAASLTSLGGSDSRVAAIDLATGETVWTHSVDTRMFEPR